MTQTALIIDDEPAILELLAITLLRMGIDTRQANSLASAYQLLSEQAFDLCLTDMHLPDGSSLELVAHIQQAHPNTPIAVITAFGSIDTAIEALKLGAFDFVSKPVELPRLRDMVKQALKLQNNTEEAVDSKNTTTELLGQSSSIHKLRGQISKVARSQAPVYISGESGSGKELVARMIHQFSPRADAPFVPVNCGAIPTELMESEFFGHKKGSFTGAVTDKTGLFQSAQGGTLFLDEVADLPLHMQVKLLRTIQEKTVRPIGSQHEEALDVRILSATHKDLAKEVKNGNFRQDMFYRINVIEINVPSLRERQEDIALLADFFLEKLGQANGTSAAQLSPAALTTLQNYTFPGNVRELENTLERAYTLCENNVIDSDDLQLRPTEVAAPPNTTTETTATAPAPVTTSAPSHDSGSLDNYLEEIEKQAILKALEETRWNRTAAAEKLGISFRQIRHRLKKFGIE
ncbi:Type IV fimbriae expression regulatory protein PilR [gamma proteobacterium IMCC2047]|nr:Type IV fimbriae expression regulatory protein PilR [gamma proteobacterium IMCC2047]